MRKIRIGGREGTVVERNEGFFPRNNEGRCAALLSSINTEPKSITLLCLSDGPMTCTTLRREFEKYMGNEWVPDDRAFFDYVHKTFVPNGMANEEMVEFTDGKKSTYFRRTMACARYGKPSALMSLEFAVDHGTSMYEFLGRSATPGETNSPHNRARIIDALDDGDMRVIDVAVMLNLRDSIVSNHLRSLRDSGLVKYESVGHDKGGYYFRWTGKKGEIPRYDGRSGFASGVAEVVKQMKKANAYEISRQLGLYSNSSVKRVSEVLSYLSQHGFVERIKWKAGEVQSQASLTAEGRDFADFLDSIRGVLHGEEADVTFARYADAMSLYENVAPARKVLPPEVRKQKILSFVRAENQEGRTPRTRDICGYLGPVYQYVSQLATEGRLMLDKKERGYRAMRC